MSSATMSSASIMLDFDASPISGQAGWAVMDVNGQLLKSNTLLERDARILFQMLQESTKAQDNQALKRLTVTFPGAARFLVTRDEKHIYIVQTRVA